MRAYREAQMTSTVVKRILSEQEIESQLIIKNLDFEKTETSLVKHIHKLGIYEVNASFEDMVRNQIKTYIQHTPARPRKLF